MNISELIENLPRSKSLVALHNNTPVWMLEPTHLLNIINQSLRVCRIANETAVPVNSFQRSLYNLPEMDDDDRAEIIRRAMDSFTWAFAALALNAYASDDDVLVLVPQYGLARDLQFYPVKVGQAGASYSMREIADAFRRAVRADECPQKALEVIPF